MRIIRYDESNIKEEVNRCLSCKNPSCEKGCPIHNHIRDFIKALKNDNLEEAKKIVYDNSNLAFICSIVCPHEKNCMGYCILNKAKKEPINIGGIEAYITKDLDKKKDIKFNDKKVAIIGSGPAGINLAIELAKNKIKPTIYEEKNHIGGVLSYGIPDFRLDVSELNKFFTSITVEEPCSYEQNNMERYYPVKDLSGANQNLYKKYASLKQDNMYFIGRCGCYKYMDMDDAFAEAYSLCKDLLS